MNKVCLVGRLTAKPELRYTNSNVAYTRFTFAVNRTFSNSQGQRDADFINVVAWRRQAETITRYFDKGNLISLDGRIHDVFVGRFMVPIHDLEGRVVGFGGRIINESDDKNSLRKIRRLFSIYIKVSGKDINNDKNTSK